MKRLAVLFFLAVFIPCGVLAWLAQRSMEEERRAYERQQLELAEAQANRLVDQTNLFLDSELRAFEQAVEQFLTEAKSQGAAKAAYFESHFEKRYAAAEVSFIWEQNDGLVAFGEMESREKLQRFVSDHDDFFAGVNRSKLDFVSAQSERFGLQESAPQAMHRLEDVAETTELGLRFANSPRSLDRRAAGVADPQAKIAADAVVSAGPTLDQIDQKAAIMNSVTPAPNQAPEPPQVELNAARQVKSIEQTSTNLKVEVAKKQEVMAKASPPANVPMALPAPLAAAAPAAPVPSDVPADTPTTATAAVKLKSETEMLTRGIKADGTQEELSVTLGDVAPAKDGVQSQRNKAAPLMEEYAIDADKPVDVTKNKTVEKFADAQPVIERELKENTERQQPADAVTFFERTVQPSHVSAKQVDQLSRFSFIPQPLDRFQSIWPTGNSGLLGRVGSGGALAIFVWMRDRGDADKIYGAQLKLPLLMEKLKASLTAADDLRSDSFALAVLNENAEPMVLMPESFTADWRKPLVSEVIGATLPKWEAALYLLNPAEAAGRIRSAQWKLGLMVLAVLVAAAVGGYLFWGETRRRWVEARQKTDFVSQVSHELRTPLTSIRMFSDLLAGKDAPADAEKTKQYAAVISQEAGRLTRLIDTVLDFSQMERNELPLNLQEIDLIPVIKETLQHLEPNLQKAGFTVHAEFPDQSIILWADADRVAQVLVNLLSNAEKYSGVGKEIEVSVQVKSQRTAVEICVADHGPGIPPGEERKIFEKFYRVDDSLHNGIPGTGLGLALARQIARAHQGELSYRARPGGGSVFVLTLPLPPERDHSSPAIG
jgi:signal transduction histidine kinase